MKVYKGTDKDMKCRGFQYKLGETATGDRGAASATGDQGAASATGKAGVALAAGRECKAMGALGCAICCVERGEWDGETYPIVGG